MELSNPTANPVALRPSSAIDVPVDREAAFRVIEAISTGVDLVTLEGDPSMPTRGQFISWIMRDGELAHAFDLARKVSSYILEDEALAVLRSRRLAKDTTSLALRSDDLYVQQLRWSAVKRNPEVFSEKAAVNVTVPIQINTSLDMGETKMDATKQFPNIYELKAETVIEVDPPKVADEPVADPVPAKRGPMKRVLVPRPRAGETVAERDMRLYAEEVAAENRTSQRKIAAKHARKWRAKEKKRGPRAEASGQLQSEPGAEELHREQGEG